MGGSGALSRSAAGSGPDAINEPDGRELTCGLDTWVPFRGDCAISIVKSRRGLPADSYVEAMTTNLDFNMVENGARAFIVESEQSLIRMAWTLILQNLDVLWWAFCRTLGDIPDYPYSTHTNARDAWDWLMNYWEPFNTLRPMLTLDYGMDDVADLPLPRAQRGRTFNIQSGAGSVNMASASVPVVSVAGHVGGVGHYQEGWEPTPASTITLYLGHDDMDLLFDIWRKETEAERACAAVHLSGVLVHELAHFAGLRLASSSGGEAHIRMSGGDTAGACAATLVIQNLWTWALLKRYKSANRSACCATLLKQESSKSSDSTPVGVGRTFDPEVLYWSDAHFSPTGECPQ